MNPHLSPVARTQILRGVHYFARTKPKFIATVIELRSEHLRVKGPIPYVYSIHEDKIGCDQVITKSDRAREKNSLMLLLY